jgi:hypothetical protein
MIIWFSYKITPNSLTFCDFSSEGKGHYEGVSKSFRTGRLERELQMVQLSATIYSFIAILWVILVSFVAVIICIASQRVFIVVVVVVYFVIDSVRKLLDTPSYEYIFLDDSPCSFYAIITFVWFVYNFFVTG